MRNKSIININLRWFLAGLIFANIAGQMAYSMLSLYMLDLGASVAQVGLAFTLASLVPMVLQIFGGWLSDTIGRLRVIAMGSSIAGFGYLIFAFAPGAKMVNFGIVYGITAFGLARRLGIGNDAAAEIIAGY